MTNSFFLEQIKSGKQLSAEEALEMYKTMSSSELIELAHIITKHNHPKIFDLCSIINAKSGKCSENCKFCAQSIHYQTDSQVYALLDPEIILSKAIESQKQGVHRFSIVTSGRELTNIDFDRILEAFKIISNNTNIKLCASLGLLTESRAKQLKECGVLRYHHNLETASSFYNKICDTHSYQDRVDTIKNAQKAGLEVCSGGIIGLGESMLQRLELAAELRRLNIESVPINILTPIKGTPLENQRKLDHKEILATIALYRLMLPKSVLRYAGGRNNISQYQEKGIYAGINGAITGDYLTTVGNSIIEDKIMVQKLGFIINDFKV